MGKRKKLPKEKLPKPSANNDPMKVIGITFRQFLQFLYRNTIGKEVRCRSIDHVNFTEKTLITALLPATPQV